MDKLTSRVLQHFSREKMTPRAIDWLLMLPKGTSHALIVEAWRKDKETKRLDKEGLGWL